MFWLFYVPKTVLSTYNRPKNKDYKISFDSKQPIDNDKSRRVEFRIVTTSEAIINEALKNINE